MPRGRVRAYHLVKDWKEVKGFIEGLATEYKESCGLKIKQRQREASIHQKKADRLPGKGTEEGVGTGRKVAR